MGADKLTADDRAALRHLSGMTWQWDGRTINLGMVLDAWADAEERATFAPSDLDNRVETFLAANLPTDSDTLTRAHATLRAQEAKGRAKYGADLDTASLSARQVLQHATEEAADLLMYLTDLVRRVAELEAENDHARGLLADLRRPYLPDGTARAVEAAADAYLAGKPAERTVGDLMARVEELEAELFSRESHRQALARELGEVQQWREAESKAAKRMAERLHALEAENERLKAFDLLAWQTAGTGSGDLRGQGLLTPECAEPAPNNAEPAPTTRSGTGELLAEGRDYQVRTVGAVPQTLPPVPCACGNVPNVCYVRGACWVECADCRRASGCYTTRADALRGWAERDGRATP